MLVKPAVFQSPQFLVSETIVLALAVSAFALLPDYWLFGVLFLVTMTVAAYVISEQVMIIDALKQEIEQYRSKEDEYVLRTEQLRRTLHDIRSPMSALKLRIQILQKTSCEADQHHLAILETSLESAIDQLQTLGDIQKGKIKPTDTMQMNLEAIRAYLDD